MVNFDGLPELDGVLGYAEVDEILTELILTIREALNTSDFIGPSGRYQICCLLSNIRSNNHAELAARKLLRILLLPFRYKKRRISLLPRIELALNSSKQDTLSHLMCNASSGLYRTACNKENIGIFDEKERDLLLTEIDIWIELDHAIEYGDLNLVYQPQIWAETKRIRSTEALLR